MDFYSIIKKINELRKELEQISLSDIEKGIIKLKMSETYLLLFEKQDVIPIVMADPSSPKEIAVEEKNMDFLDGMNISASQQPIEQKSQQKKPLNIDYKSLVDTFLEKDPEKPTAIEDNSLLSKMSQMKIVDLKRSIAMNDRFIFIKELFKNDFDTYNCYINNFNECKNMEQAEQYFSLLKKQYEWDEENETVQYFLSLIKRKLC